MKINYKKYYDDNESINYAKITKNNELDYTKIMTRTSLDSFCDEKNISKSDNSYYIKETLENYGLDLNFIVREESKDSNKKSYKIPIISEDILAIMVNSTKNNVIKQAKDIDKISLDNVIEYNKKLFKDIDKLPRRLKNEIKLSETFKINKELNILMEMLLNRVNLLFNILLSESDVNAGNQIKRLISYIDKFLYSYTEKKLSLEKINNINYDEVLCSKDKKTLKDFFLLDIDDLDLENISIHELRNLCVNQLKALKIIDEDDLENNVNNTGIKDIGEANYLLESIFKEEFLKSIKDNIDILDYLKKSDINIEEVKKELEKIYKINDVDGKKHFKSDDLYILYKSKLYEENYESYINKYKESLILKEKVISKNDKNIKNLRANGKYFLNETKISKILREDFYDKYIISILNELFTSYRSISIYEDDIDIDIYKYCKRIGLPICNYYYFEEKKNNLKAYAYFINRYNRKWSEIEAKYINVFMEESLFGKYPNGLKFKLKKVYRELVHYIKEQLLLICKSEEFYGISKYDDFYNNRLIFFTMQGLNNCVNLFLKKYDYDDNVITELRQMYKKQNLKDNKVIKIKNEIKKLNEKIEKMELKKETSSNKTKLNNLIKENKKKIIELENKLLEMEDLRSCLSMALGKIFITALYTDKNIMNKKNLDLKKYLNILDSKKDNFA